MFAIGTLIRNHLAALLASLVLGVLIAAPPVFFRFSPQYQGLDMLKHNTEAHYLAQVQEVYDGFGTLGNPFFADLKDQPYLFPPLSPHIIARFGQLFGLGAVDAVMTTRLIFTVLLSIAIYFFALELTRSKRVALVAPFAVLLGSAFLDPRYVFRIFQPGAWLGENSFIDYGRPVNPGLSSLFFFAYLVFFWRYLHHGSSPEQEREAVIVTETESVGWLSVAWRRVWFMSPGERTVAGVVCTVLLGMSFYAYLYTWTFLLVLNAMLFAIYAAKRDWQRVQKIGMVSFGALLIGAPYLAHVFGVRAHAWYAESALRFGFVPTRLPDVSRTVIASFILFLLLKRKLFRGSLGIFFSAFFLTAIVVVNEQLVTGLYLFNHHYHWYYTTPLLILFLLSIIFLFLEKVRLQKFASFLAVTFILLSLYNGMLVQTTSYRTVLPQVADEQRYVPFLSWVQRETPVASSFLTSHHLSEFLSATTHGDSYYTGSTVYTLVPNDRLAHAYLTYQYLAGVPTSSIRTHLDDRREEVSNFVFAYQYRFSPGVCLGCFPDQVLDEMAALYESITDDNFASFIKTYPVDYVVWDRADDPAWNIDNRFGWNRAEEFGDIIVYRL